MFVAYGAVVAALYNPYLVCLLCLSLPSLHLSDFFIVLDLSQSGTTPPLAPSLPPPLPTTLSPSSTPPNEKVTSTVDLSSVPDDTLGEIP